MITNKFLLLAAFALPVFVSGQITCPQTPTPWPAPSSFPRISYLPDPFTYLDGTTRVKSPEEWLACRQPEIVKLLQHYQYGVYPDTSAETVAATRSGNSLTVTVRANGRTGTFRASIALPSGANQNAPVPVVIAIGGMDNNPYLREGIAVVTLDYMSVAPDSNGKTGGFWQLYNGRDAGTLLAWAWGVHRTIDALDLQVREIDTKRGVGVTGCSRLGKAALAAGLLDTRVTVTMPMSSGVQGLGPYRYSLSGQGENLENSKQGAGWWTSSVLSGFLNNAQRLPFDAHTIAAAIAPRALIIDQGQSDPFVDSRGTAVATFPAAKVVYDFLGAGDKIGLALRNGGHCDFAGYTNVLPFVTKIFKGAATTRNYHSTSPWSPLTTAFPWSTNVPR